MYAFTVISMAEGLGNKLGKAILQVKKKNEKEKERLCLPILHGFFCGTVHILEDIRL